MNIKQNSLQAGTQWIFLVSLVLVCVFGVAITAHAAGPNLVVNGNFETPGINNAYNGNMWQIYGGASAPGVWGPAPAIPGWENNSNGYQIELQRNGLNGNSAQSGSQWAEVDNPGAMQLRQNIASLS